jgi:NAD-dependent DNA ligase
VYKVFDAPSIHQPFEKRVQALREYFAQHKAQFVQLVEQTICRGPAHLGEVLKEVEALGGEGLMLRKSGSEYVGSRSSTLLKVKSFYDSEAIVLRHEPGKGKFQGMCGALFVQMGDGTKFAVGSGLDNNDRMNPPPVGSVITFRYQELSDKGVPRFPTYVGVRIDAKWPPDEDARPQHVKPLAKQGKTKANAPAKAAKPAKPLNPDAPSQALDGLNIAFTGTHSIVRRELESLIERNGGTFNATVTGKTSVLVATLDELRVKTKKIQLAITKK